MEDLINKLSLRANHTTFRVGFVNIICSETPNDGETSHIQLEWMPPERLSNEDRQG